MRTRKLTFACLVLAAIGAVHAAGGPFGTAVAGAVWEGGETRLGYTYWEALDAGALASGEAAKRAFTRERPIEGNDPDA